VKAYLVFAFAEYYPDGGWNDLVGDADTFDEAQTLREKATADLGSYAHAHIVHDGKIIETFTQTKE
jgi:hypothetical protein